MAGNGGEIYKCVFRSGITRGRKKGDGDSLDSISKRFESWQK